MKKISLLIILKKSFELLKKEPKLFLPKTLIAILYGVLIALQGQLIIEFVNVYSIGITTEHLPIIANFLTNALLILFLSIIVYVLDTVFTAMYPNLVKQYPEKISFRKAYRESKNRFFIAIFSSFLLLIIATTITAIIMIPLTLISQDQPFFQVIISLSVGLFTIFFFYLLLPIIMLEQKGVLFSIKKSIKMSVNNKKNIFALSLIPLIITIIKLGLSFFINDPLVLITFIILVLFTAILQTYSIVATQTTYFEVK